MTLELGRMRTWRLPLFSALLMAFSASLRTEVLTILAVYEDSQGARRREVSAKLLSASRSHGERKECPSVLVTRVLQLGRRGRSSIIVGERAMSAGRGYLKGISCRVRYIPLRMYGVGVIESRLVAVLQWFDAEIEAAKTAVDAWTSLDFLRGSLWLCRRWLFCAGNPSG